MAAHISAASPGGPRYDPALTSTARASIENGLWLCQACGKVIDDAPTAFTVDGLRAWKQFAEAAAARAATAAIDQVADLLTDLDTAHATLLDFAHRWQQGEPAHDFNDFDASTAVTIRYFFDRRSAYHATVSPRVTAVLVTASKLLGEEAREVIDATDAARLAPTNYLSALNLADALQRLRAVLALR